MCTPNVFVSAAAHVVYDPPWFLQMLGHDRADTPCNVSTVNTSSALHCSVSTTNSDVEQLAPALGCAYGLPATRKGASACGAALTTAVVVDVVRRSNSVSIHAARVSIIPATVRCKRTQHGHGKRNKTCDELWRLQVNVYCDALWCDVM